jgi:hypothetical protein
MNRIQDIAAAHGFDLGSDCAFLRIDLKDETFIVLEKQDEDIVAFGVWHDADEAELIFEYVFGIHAGKWVLYEFATQQVRVMTARADYPHGYRIVNPREYRRALTILQAYFEDLIRIAA